MKTRRSFSLFQWSTLKQADSVWDTAGREIRDHVETFKDGDTF